MNEKAVFPSSGFTLMELMVITAIVALLMAIAIPNYLAYRNNSFCSQAENDAASISGAISDYFAIPSHTQLPTPADLKVATRNPFTVTGDPNINISIIVTDRTGRCPDAYQRAHEMWDPIANTFTQNIR